MKRTFSIISFILFLVALAAYTAVFLGYDTFLLPGVIVSVVGIIVALFSEKGVYKRIGLIGNSLIVFSAVIIPMIVTTFFWNTP